MANNFETTQLVANMALAEFVNNNSLVMTANRGYESDFKSSDYKYGDTINIRKQNHAVVQDGQVAVIEDIDEEVVPLTINHQYNTTISYTSKELSLDIDTGYERFNERYIRPRIQEIIHQMNRQIFLDSIAQLNYVSGSAASAVNTFAGVDLTGAAMLEHAMPILDDAYMSLSVRDASALKSALQNSFNDTLNDDISFRSALGHLSYFDIFQDQSVPTHTTGTFPGTPLVNGAVTSGNTIVMDGFTVSQTGVLLAGDVITIGDSSNGVFSVNPVGRDTTGQLMQFVVLADVDSDGGGNATVTVSPSIVSDPADSRRNVSNEIPNNGVVNMIGAAQGKYKVNVAYAKRGLDIVVPPMETLDIPASFVVTDKDANVSLRIGRQGDILNDVNVLRIDVLCGFLWHPQYATKVISQV